MTTENAKPLSPEEQEAIRQRADAATPELWTAESGYVGAMRTLFLVRGDRFDGVLFGRGYDAAETAQHEADTTFTANARTDIPRLLDTIKERDDRIAAIAARNAELMWAVEAMFPHMPGIGHLQVVGTCAKCGKDTPSMGMRYCGGCASDIARTVTGRTRPSAPSQGEEERP